MCLFRLFVIVAAVFITGCGQNSSRSDAALVLDIEEEKEALRYLKEVEWPQAYREQDTILLDRILGEDFQMVGADGTWSDKAGQMERIKAAPMDNDHFEFEIKRLDIDQNGTAIVAGTGHVIKDGQKMIYQSSNVLIKRGDKWKAVLSHVSGIEHLGAVSEEGISALPKEADFSYLLGEWKRTNETAGKETYEAWKKISEEEYIGLGYTLSAGDTIWKENIKLIKEVDHWDYEVTGQGDTQPTPFKVTKVSSNGFECFNPVNEFPKTIQYKREGNSLNALISDGETEVVFHFEALNN